MLKEILRTPIYWMLIFVPAVLVSEHVQPEAKTLTFALSLLAIIPLAGLLSRSTEAVAARTGDAVGGLLNATLGNLTELMVAVSALKAGQFMLVKASVAGAIVTNSLFMLGTSFLLGGLRHHVQEYSQASVRLQSGLLFLATVALLVPSMVGRADSAGTFPMTLSLGIAVILIVTYLLGLLFTLKTHKALLAAPHEAEAEEESWALVPSLVLLAGVTVLVAVVSEIFVGSVEAASHALGLTPAFVGFILVAMVGGAAEMTTAFSAARKNRLDLSLSIALGSSTQIALFVAPLMVLLSYPLAPTPMDLQFWPGAVVMLLIATLTVSLISTGRATWYTGVVVLAIYAIFALTLYLMPPPEKEGSAFHPGAGCLILTHDSPPARTITTL